MKIKQVESLLKAAKYIELFTERGCQWLGDGAAFYPFYNLPKFTQQHVFTIFDIPEDKRSKILFNEREAPVYLELSDSAVNENLVQPMRTSLLLDGRTIALIPTSYGLVCIDRKYLNPFKDASGGYELYERVSDKIGVYIVVKTGFSLAGVILPLRIINEELVQELEYIVRLANFALPQKSTASDRRCKICQ